MRIVICVKLDLEGSIVLNKIVRELSHHELFIILSDKVMKAEREIRTASEFLFYERDLLVEQLFPMMDRLPTPEDTPGRLYTHAQITEKFNLPIVTADNINSPEWEQKLKDFAPDLVLSVRYDLIFKQNIIDIPRLGILNIHPGKLPEFRGVYAPFQAMLNNDDKIGVTLHRVVEEIDAGPIVDIVYIDVDPSKSVIWHMCHTYPAGVDAFLKILPSLEQGGNLETYEQDHSKKKYYSFPSEDVFLEFLSRGKKLIDPDEYLDIVSNYQK